MQRLFGGRQEIVRDRYWIYVPPLAGAAVLGQQALEAQAWQRLFGRSQKIVRNRLAYGSLDVEQEASSLRMMDFDSVEHVQQQSGKRGERGGERGSGLNQKRDTVKDKRPVDEEKDAAMDRRTVQRWARKAERDAMVELN